MQRIFINLTLGLMLMTGLANADIGPARETSRTPVTTTPATKTQKPATGGYLNLDARQSRSLNDLSLEVTKKAHHSRVRVRLYFVGFEAEDPVLPQRSYPGMVDGTEAVSSNVVVVNVDGKARLPVRAARTSYGLCLDAELVLADLPAGRHLVTLKVPGALALKAPQGFLAIDELP